MKINIFFFTKICYTCIVNMSFPLLVPISEVKSLPWTNIKILKYAINHLFRSL